MDSNNLTLDYYTPFDPPTLLQENRFVDFLCKQLNKGEQKRDAARVAVDYALKRIPSLGGFILTLSKGLDLYGIVVVNKTGMRGYIPENILVYIAVLKDFRRQGLGERLLQEAISRADGDIALHIEHDNPARKLYEKFGFKNKYVEMRLGLDDYKKQKATEAISAKAEI